MWVFCGPIYPAEFALQHAGSALGNRGIVVLEWLGRVQVGFFGNILVPEQICGCL
jgi:hypothetical protein